MRGHAASSYVPLWCKSNYSFLEGASHPAELMAQAARYGLPALALTDRNGLYGAVRAHVAARDTDVRPLVGSEITLCEGGSVVLLATSRTGYANLCQVIATGRLRSPKGQCRIQTEELCERPGGLILLWGGNPGGSRAADLRDAFGDRMYGLITRHYQSGERIREQTLREKARRLDLSLVASTEVLYHERSRRALQDVLSCIRHGVSLATAGTCIRPNAAHALLSPTAFAALFADDKPAMERTREVAERCCFSLSDIHYRYPSETQPGERTSGSLLRRRTFAGAAARYPSGIPAIVRRQIEKELNLIRDLEYEGYFLTMWDLVQFCRRRQILCQGRGSAANSAICFCLGITAVDPVRMELLFERFISRQRSEPPDIDLDIEHDRREEVIQYVYRKYGRSHAAMVANFIRYRMRSALRDVGKALGFPEITLERIVKNLTSSGRTDGARLAEAARNQRLRHLLRLSGQIQDMPRHLSIHPGGFLLGRDPIHTLVPTENAAMAERTVIQWDKEDIEDLGLFKVDLLGLGALNVVHRTFDLIRDHHGENLDMASLPEGDEPTYEMIGRADTVGVFQIESRAQMSMLPRLRPRTYYDLVIEVSIVRPGPITGGMVHPYLRRRNGEEPVTYPHPCLESVLRKTLGIPLFQEQVMQLAIVAADYTPGEADQLRRDMGAWRSSGRIERHRERLIGRMEAKGIQRAFGEQVFSQIQGFGEYGFPESHAASFALIVYATSYLKCHYAAAYLCAMLNAQPMGFYSPASLVEDALRHGVTVRPVDVFQSQWDCTLEPLEAAVNAAQPRAHFAVRIGFRYVKGLRCADLIPLLETSPRKPALLGVAVQARLAEAGAFDREREGNRRATLWHALGADPNVEGEFNLIRQEAPVALERLSDLETIQWDYQTSGHSTRGHPLMPLREAIKARGFPDAATVRALPHDSPVDYVGMVICRQRPGTAKGVLFITLEDETGFANLVIWQDVHDKFRTLICGASFLGVSGTVQSEAGVVHIVVKTVWKPDFTAQPPETRSRDFH